MNADLISRLRALAKAEHMDLEVADEAADLIEGIAKVISEGVMKQVRVGIIERLLRDYGVKYK